MAAPAPAAAAPAAATAVTLEEADVARQFSTQSSTGDWERQMDTALGIGEEQEASGGQVKPEVEAKPKEEEEVKPLQVEFVAKVADETRKDPR